MITGSSGPRPSARRRGLRAAGWLAVVALLVAFDEPAPPRVRVDRAAAYRGFLVELPKTEVYRNGWDFRTIVLREAPYPCAPCGWSELTKCLPALRRETYLDLVESQRAAAPLPDLRSAGGRDVVLEPESELDHLFQRTGTGPFDCGFYERYPDGEFFALSAMGFSRDGTQGLLYASGGGQGSFYLLERVGTRWRIAATCGFIQS